MLGHSLSRPSRRSAGSPVSAHGVRPPTLNVTRAHARAASVSAFGSCLTKLCSIFVFGTHVQPCAKKWPGATHMLQIYQSRMRLDDETDIMQRAHIPYSTRTAAYLGGAVRARCARPRRAVRRCARGRRARYHRRPHSVATRRHATSTTHRRKGATTPQRVPRRRHRPARRPPSRPPRVPCWNSTCRCSTPTGGSAPTQTTARTPGR